MKTLTRNKPTLSRLRACLAAPLRWLKLDGGDRDSRMMCHEVLLFVLTMLALGGIMAINVGLPQPQESQTLVFAKGMMVWINLIFILWFVGGLTLLVFRGAWGQWFQGGYRPLALQMLRFLRRIALFLYCGQCLIWACNVFGDHLFRAEAERQTEMLALIPVLLAITVSRPLFGRHDVSTVIIGNDSHAADDAHARFAALTTQLAEQLRQHDAVMDDPWYLRSTAAHEAGHMLVCAALHDTPQDITLHLEMRGDTAGYIKPGFGVDLNAPRFCNDPVCIHWLMLLLQAGAVAERYLTGRDGFGASNDNRHWLSCAHMYLANQYGDTIYYAAPSNEQEQAHNVRELNALKQQQRALLSTFFDLNDAVLRDLSAAAQEKRTLRRDELLPFFARVRFPEGFPGPDLAALAEG